MRELRGADVAALLDKEILNEGNPSVSFISAFAAYENTGRRDNKLKEEILSSKKRLDNFKLIISVCCIYLGYTYARCEHYVHFDDRNKESSEYCAEHYEMFLDWYKELTKSEFPFRENRREQYFLRDIAIKGHLLKEIEAFSNTHRTLQQSCMDEALSILGVPRKYRFSYI